VLPIELESMVFGASQVEGVWPPDTLLLLFGLIQRDLKLGEEGVDLHRTVVISKTRVVTAEQFPAHLRLTLLAPLMHEPVSRIADQVTVQRRGWGRAGRRGPHPAGARAMRFYQRRQAITPPCEVARWNADPLRRSA
jgi:hypothetical protein